MDSREKVFGSMPTAADIQITGKADDVVDTVKLATKAIENSGKFKDVWAYAIALTKSGDAIKLKTCSTMSGCIVLVYEGTMDPNFHVQLQPFDKDNKGFGIMRTNYFGDNPQNAYYYDKIYSTEINDADIPLDV